jgi:hypothetical protein
MLLTHNTSGWTTETILTANRAECSSEKETQLTLQERIYANQTEARLKVVLQAGSYGKVV